MEVFSKFPTLKQQQFVYMIDRVWIFLIAYVFNLQIEETTAAVCFCKSVDVTTTTLAGKNTKHVDFVF